MIVLKNRYLKNLVHEKETALKRQPLCLFLTKRINSFFPKLPLLHVRVFLKFLNSLFLLHLIVIR